MSYSINSYTGNGSTTQFPVTFTYLDKTHVEVRVAGVLKTVTTDYTWVSSGMIQMNSAPANGASVVFRRVTPKTTRLVNFQDASVLTANDLNTEGNQEFYVMQETLDNNLGLAAAGTYWDAQNLQLSNLPTPVGATDAVRKDYVDSTIPANVASAASSASTASSAASSANSSFLSVDKKYLGAKASPPTLDNQGAALTTGALYFNTSNNTMYAWNGSVWNAASFAGTLGVGQGGTGGTDAATARSNLGAAASGANTDITSLNSPSLGSATATTQTSGDATTKVATTAFVDPLRDISANSQGASYTLALTDRGKSIDFTGAAAQTITIPANASVAFPVGSTVTITNTTANNLSIAITTDTLRQAGTANTGTRTLAQYGIATIRKVASTTWIIAGSGLT